MPSSASNSPPCNELVITDTIPQATTSEKIRVLSVANLFAAVMHKVNSNESISGHFLM